MNIEPLDPVLPWVWCVLVCLDSGHRVSLSVLPPGSCLLCYCVSKYCASLDILLLGTGSPQVSCFWLSCFLEYCGSGHHAFGYGGLWATCLTPLVHCTRLSPPGRWLLQGPWQHMAAARLRAEHCAHGGSTAFWGTPPKNFELRKTNKQTNRKKPHPDYFVLRKKICFLFSQS